LNDVEGGLFVEGLEPLGRGDESVEGVLPYGTRDVAWVVG